MGWWVGAVGWLLLAGAFSEFGRLFVVDRWLFRCAGVGSLLVVVMCVWCGVGL